MHSVELQVWKAVWNWNLNRRYTVSAKCAVRVRIHGIIHVTAGDSNPTTDNTELQRLRYSERQNTEEKAILAKADIEVRRIFIQCTQFRIYGPHLSRLKRPYTGIGARMSHRIWRVTKLHPSRTSSGHQIRCCLFSLLFLYDILAPITVHWAKPI